MGKMMILVHTVDTVGLNREQANQKVKDRRISDTVIDETEYYDIKNIFVAGVNNDVKCIFPTENIKFNFNNGGNTGTGPYKKNYKKEYDPNKYNSDKY